MRARPSSPRGKENNSSDEVECPGRARPKGRMPSPVTRTNEMMYSSISPPERRAASAKTISEQCFPGQSPSSAASPPPEYSPLDSVGDQVEVESYALDESEASPESRRIMAKMEQVYQSSPIPKDYLNTPPKKSPALPEIVLHPRPAADAEAAKKSAGATAAKKGAASKSRPRRKDPRDATTTRATHGIPAASAIYGGGKGGARRPRRLSSAADAAGTDRRGSVAGGRGRETFSAPDVAAGGAAKSGGAATRAVVKPPAALAVQRERRQRKSRQKDAEASSNEADGRRNLDKRTARLRFRDGFRADIARHRQRFPHLNDGSNHADKAGGQIQDRGANGVSIAVRKRPIFKYELDRGDYDVVSIDNVTGDSHDVCMVHNCGMHADMKQMLVKSTRYPVTAAFDEHCDDDIMYRHIAEPLVLDAVNGGVATILMFGQTGTGKSFTMSGIESRAVRGLFQAIDAIDSQPADRPRGERPAVTLQFVELCGSKEVRDLLVTGRGTDAPVKLADNDDGSVRLLNAVSLVIASPAELLEKIALAKGQRATEATDKNGVSSRSHAVCQVRIRGAGRGRGVLTLIDCAGSERKHDSMYHSSERQKETAEINASLWALKECVRARAKKLDRIPFRSSSLTRILKESFEREGARLTVIACVAPNASDTEHTMETLKTVASIVGVDDQIKEEKAHVVESPKPHARPAPLPPKQWDHDHLQKFLVHKKMLRVRLLEKHDGKALMKMSVPQMRAHLFDDRDKELAPRLFDLLRKENERVAQLQRREREILKKERKGRV